MTSHSGIPSSGHLRKCSIRVGSAQRSRRVRGAASVEAVIVLPFFILIFAGVLYVHHLWENRQIALMTARQCAWLFSASGCDEQPSGCEGLVHAAGAEEQQNEVTDELDGGVIDQLSGIPFLGPAIRGIFGTALEANIERQTRRPPVLGGGRVPVAARYYMMCNEKAQTLGELISGSFCGLVSAITDDGAFPGC